LPHNQTFAFRRVARHIVRAIERVRRTLIVITILLSALLAPLVVITAVFATEVLAGLGRLPAVPPGQGASATIVIPAHDEELVIGQTISALRSEVVERFPILVVADNCGDRTRTAAEEAGATVFVRDDRDRRGKGYALAAAREALRGNASSAVIILDADCRMDRRSLENLAAAAVETGRPSQAINLLRPDLSASPMVQISTFAFMIKNLVRQRGLYRVAKRCHLTGTGMALPWSLFETANLGGSNIVEDLALGVEMAAANSAPMLVEGATVWSPAASQSGTLVQRSRWEGGYLATALKVAPVATVSCVARGDWRGLFGALDLAIPPLALLVVLNAIAFTIALVGALLGVSWWLVIVQAAIGLVAFLALAAAWAREGRQFASGTTLLRLPLYIFWKIPMYLGLARRGAPKEWLRTGR
jgi:cellulose synthase/poly-beta-1,6-N-acetylglucosamine synthase-like glycosyltransferase